MGNGSPAQCSRLTAPPISATDVRSNRSSAGDTNPARHASADSTPATTKSPRTPSHSPSGPASASPTGPARPITVESSDSARPYEFSLRVPDNATGTLEFVARASDFAGQVSQSDTVEVDLIR